MLLVGARLPLFAQRADTVEHRHQLLDGVDSAALTPVPLRHLRVPGTAGHGDQRRDRAAAAHPGVELGGLGGDTCVGPHAVRDGGAAAGAARLLVGDRAEHDVAGKADALAAQRLQGDHQPRDAALHVVGAAAVQVAGALGEPIRVAEPLPAWLDVDGVDVTVDQKATAGACAGQSRGELRPPGEVEAGRNEAVAVAGGLRLPEVRRRAQRLEARGEQPLQLLFIVRRVAGVPRRGVADDKLGGQADQLVLGRAHGFDDALFERRLQFHPVPPRTTDTCGAGGIQWRRRSDTAILRRPGQADADDQEDRWATCTTPGSA